MELHHTICKDILLYTYIFIASSNLFSVSNIVVGGGNFK